MTPIQLTFLITMASTKLEKAPPDKGIMVDILDESLNDTDKAFIMQCGMGVEDRGASVRVTPVIICPHHSLRAAKQAVTNIKPTPLPCSIVHHYFIFKL